MARRPTTHKDVDFEVDVGKRSQSYKRFDDAAAFAVSLAAGDGTRVMLDVVVHSRAGAKWYGGDDAVKVYDEDPEASVFERFEIKVHAFGRVP